MDGELKRIVEKAEAMGVAEWGQKIQEWAGRLERGEEGTAQGWFLTDLRYLHNIASPHFQGYITAGTPPDREDALLELCHDIHDYIEDQFEE